MSIQAMKQALEALEQSFIIPNSKMSPLARDRTITALRAALEAAEECEPVAWMTPDTLWVWTTRDEVPKRWAASVIPLYTHPHPAVPEGWRWVPVEPTQEMCKVFHNTYLVKSFTDAYKAMLAATPEYKP